MRRSPLAAVALAVLTSLPAEAGIVELMEAVKLEAAPPSGGAVARSGGPAAQAAVTTTVVPKGATLFQPSVTPGGMAVVTGTGFGTSNGKLLLTGLKTSLGNAVAPIPLEILGWDAGLILAVVPADVSGVMSQPAKLRVIPGPPAPLADIEYPVTFKAALELRWLTGGFVKVKSCGGGTPGDKCSTQGGGCAFCGGHGAAYDLGGKKVSGTDTFEVTLPKGWVFHDLDWSPKDAPSLNPPGGFPKGGTSWSPSVQWKVTPLDSGFGFMLWDWVEYHADILVRGPKGTLP